MKNIITPIFFLLVSIGLFFLFINPQYQASKVSAANLASLDQTENEAQNLTTLEQSVRDKYNGFTTDQIGRLQELLPDSVDTIRLITEINSIAASDNVTLKDLTMGTADQGTGDTGGAIISSNQTNYGTLTFSFSVTASYTQFIAFLQDLEHSLQLIDVNSISISGVGDKSSVYTYDVNAQTYWLK